MKKSIVALAIAAAAVSGAANAKVDVYNNDGLSVQLSGEASAHMITAQSKIKGTDGKAKADPSVVGYGKVQVDTQYRISSSTTAFGSFELEGWSGGNDVEINGETASKASAVEVDDIVVGFENVDAGKFSFGETGASFAVLEKTDITNEAVYAASAGHPTESKGKGVRWEKEVSGVAFSVDAQTSAESEDNFYGLSADWAVNDVFTVGAAYLDGGTNDSGDYDVNSYGISASAQLDALYLAATVTQYNGMNEIESSGETEYQLAADADTNGMTYGFAAAYQMDATRFYGTFALIDAKENSESDADVDAELMSITVGVDQELVKNVKVYAEYTNLNLEKGKGSAKEEITDDILMLGGYFTF